MMGDDQASQAGANGLSTMRTPPADAGDEKTAPVLRLGVAAAKTNAARIHPRTAA